MSEDHKIKKYSRLNSDLSPTSKLSVCSIRILSTFTLDPIFPILKFWSNKLPTRPIIETADYGQVMQELLDSGSKTRLNKGGISVLFIRLEDIFRDFPKQDFYIQAITKLLKEYISQLVDGVRLNIAKTNCPHLMIICPPSLTTLKDKQLFTVIQNEEKYLKEATNQISNLFLIGSLEISFKHPTPQIYGMIEEELAHIPYTQEFYATLATTIARYYCSVKLPRPKAIILDCDNTLWRGVIGEDKVKGIKIDKARKQLQTQLIDRHRAGIILCLCSKNAEEDVLEVFRQSSTIKMPLSIKDITTWEINWNNKSENIRKIANRLNISLDSLAFIDDNEIECERMRIECPDVLTLQLPQNEREISTFVNDIWLFDLGKSTEEDKKRTQMIQDNLKRDKALKTSHSFATFIKSLSLEVSIEEASSSTINRISQLTQRTNQFNSTSLRKNESEIEELIKKPNTHLFTVSVKDRYGDYGLVGAIITRKKTNVIVIDNMLLSCRVLGRGIEYNVLNKLGEYAKEKGSQEVLLKFQLSNKNKPFLMFIDEINKQCAHKTQIKGGYLYKSDELMRVKFNTGDIQTISTKMIEKPTSVNNHIINNVINKRDMEVFLEEVRNKYNSPKQVIDALPKVNRIKLAKKTRLKVIYTAPQDELQKTLCKLWGEVLELQHAKVGINDDFFKLGGNSILAIKLVNKINQELSCSLTITEIFKYKNIFKLSSHLRNSKSQLDPIKPLCVSRKEDQLISFSQERLLTTEKDLDNTYPAVFELSNKVQINILKQSIESILRRHEIS